MTSVWIIESGNYSDYQVNGIFSTKEKAERAAKWIDRSQVVERELDPVVDKIDSNLDLYLIHMHYSGEVIEQDNDEYYVSPGWYGELEHLSFDNQIRIDSDSIWQLRAGVWRRSTECNDIIIGQIWAESKEEAIKILDKIRIQAIADGVLITSKQARNICHNNASTEHLDKVQRWCENL